MTLAETIVIAWCLSIIITDLGTRRLPNVLTLGVCLIALAWLLSTGHSMLDASWSSTLTGVLFALGLTLPAYAARMLGAGDVKLFLAIALIGNHMLTLLTFVIAAFLAMAFAMGHVMLNYPNSPLARSKRWVPFGAALCGGLLCAMRVTT